MFPLLLFVRTDLLTGAPAATSPTRMEVEEDELCTRTVTTTPSITPTTGLPSKEEFAKKTETKVHMFF